VRAWPVFALALALWAGAHARDRLDAWIAATVLPAPMVETGVEVLARDGRLLRAYTVADGRWRLAATASEVDRDYLAMLVAYEDRRFWRHRGVDPLALLRAGWQALRAGRPVSGGSTLTMQVARLLEDSGTGRWAGKLRQIRVALALERRLSKEAILALYLDLAPMGGNIEGVRAAAFAWFGKEPRRLTPAEAALLIALPQSPEARRPDRAPRAARAARDRVLDRMVRAGLLDASAAAAARTEPVPAARRPFPALAAHLADRLRAESPLARRHATTIDAGLQARLERLAADAVAGEAERLSVAILVADHASGEVLASVGSAGYLDGAREGFLDMTRALRSPGSTLKPLVYGLAFDRGLAHPETLIEDRPVAFGTYAPQNFDRNFRGTVRLREALQLSLNIPVVLLAEALGPESLLAALRRAGIGAELPGGQPGLAVALGGVGVSLEGLVALYGGIARGGTVVPLQAVAGPPGPPRRLISPEAAWHLGDILAALPPPPGAPANRLAYKTGTSYGHRDALALGFDGRHVAGVWMGRTDGTAVPGAFGAGLAAPILFEAFARLKPALDPLPPPPPATLIAANPALPPPLRRFRGRDGALSADPEAPAVAFPPDGAEVETAGGPLVVRVRNGVAPFTWLADGRPFAVATREREALLEDAGPGFLTLSVIDAEGRAARVQVVLR
jgi:penicillin-binding protein 1C